MIVGEQRSEAMLNEWSRVQLTGAWSGLVAEVGAAAVVAGVALTIGNLALLLASFVVPPTMMLLLSRAPSVARVLSNSAGA
jgi:hypothetical protein